MIDYFDEYNSNGAYAEVADDVLHLYITIGVSTPDSR